MTLAATEIPVDREYAALVRKFPPRPIHNEREYDATVAVMNTLAIRQESTLTRAEADYLDALATFVKGWDDEHYPAPKLSVLSRLNYLVKEAGMSASDLGRLLGNRGLGSPLLMGKRELSKAHIRTLSGHFKVRADYFL